MRAKAGLSIGRVTGVVGTFHSKELERVPAIGTDRQARCSFEKQEEEEELEDVARRKKRRDDSAAAEAEFDNLKTYRKNRN